MRAMYQRTTWVTVYLWLRYNCSSWVTVTSSRSRSIASCAAFLPEDVIPVCDYKHPVLSSVNTTVTTEQLPRIFMRSFGAFFCQYCGYHPLGPHRDNCVFLSPS